MIWLHRYTQLLSAAALLLIAAGGLVTSTGSGLAVPDWPTTYGYFMFSFPLSKMVGGIFYEHGHRLIASIVGCLTIGLVVGLRWWEPRRWVRRLGAVALAAVIVQGILGGITVIYFLPAPVSIGHAGLAQLFFALVVSLAVFTSPGWVSADRLRPGVAPLVQGDDTALGRLALLLPATVYVQILIGATMRHTGAGLAIPDFPLAFGHLLPPAWTPAIAVHFAHRLGAVVTLLLAIATLGHVWTHHRGRKELVRPASLLVALVMVQVALGAWIVLSRKAVDVNTAHVATGALVWVTSVVLALRVHRSWFPDATASPATAGAFRSREAAGVIASVVSPKFLDRFSGARRPAGKARRPRLSGIFEGGATPPGRGPQRGSRVGVADGMPRPENVKEFGRHDTRPRRSETRA